MHKLLVDILLCLVRVHTYHWLGVPACTNPTQQIVVAACRNSYPSPTTAQLHTISKLFKIRAHKFMFALCSANVRLQTLLTDIRHYSPCSTTISKLFKIRAHKFVFALCSANVRFQAPDETTQRIFSRNNHPNRLFHLCGLHDKLFIAFK